MAWELQHYKKRWWVDRCYLGRHAIRVQQNTCKTTRIVAPPPPPGPPTVSCYRRLHRLIVHICVVLCYPHVWSAVLSFKESGGASALASAPSPTRRSQTTRSPMPSRTSSLPKRRLPLPTSKEICRHSQTRPKAIQRYLLACFLALCLWLCNVVTVVKDEAEPQMTRSETHNGSLSFTGNATAWTHWLAPSTPRIPRSHSEHRWQRLRLRHHFAIHLLAPPQPPCPA